MRADELLRPQYRVAGTFFMAGLLMTTVIGAADPTREGAAAPPQAVAPNQSLSVGEGSEVPTTMNEPAFDGAGAQSAPETPDPEMGNTATVIERRLRSPRDSAVTRITPPHVVPWFRTGLGALAIVLTLIGAGAWALRRWMPNVRPVEGSLLRVVGRASLSPKHSAALIHVGRRFVLVGMSGDRVQLLSELHDADEVADLTAMAGVSRHRRGAEFETLLRQHADDADADDADAAGANGAGKRAALGPTSAPRATRDLLHKLRAWQAV